MSDRVGRRFTLILASVLWLAGAVLLAVGGAFWVFALAQVCMGAGMAFASGTDSALYFESLAAEGRKGEVEARELTAWRYEFAGLAISAALGGALAVWDPQLPFVATALAAARRWAWHCASPSHPMRPRRPRLPWPPQAPATLRAALADRALVWLFVLAIALYVFSHVPYVFGQPFILEALEGRGLSADAPLVSGAVVAAMMAVSVAASWARAGAPPGARLSGILLAAFAIQIVLIGALAASNHPLVIGLLLLRMVPDSWSTPFMLAAIQPRLADRRRATFLSLQSLGGRLVFAGTLVAFALKAPEEATLAYPEIRVILAWYAAAGLAVLLTLARRAAAPDSSASSGRHPAAEIGSMTLGSSRTWAKGPWVRTLPSASTITGSQRRAITSMSCSTMQKV